MEGEERKEGAQGTLGCEHKRRRPHDRFAPPQHTRTHTRTRTQIAAKLARLRGVKDLPAFRAAEAEVAGFLAALPLMRALKSDALRPRHWRALMAATGRAFDVDAWSFTLGSMFALQLHRVRVRFPLERPLSLLCIGGAVAQPNLPTCPPLSFSPSPLRAAPTHPTQNNKTKTTVR